MSHHLRQGKALSHALSARRCRLKAGRSHLRGWKAAGVPVTGVSSFAKAQERFSPLYRELSAALAAEGEEIDALTAKAEDLARQREKAQAAADAEIAKASKPVSSVISALSGIADRLRELRS